jgi:hypothetical protein
LVLPHGSLLLRKRALIESVDEQRKHICQVVRMRHRSVHNALAHLLAALIAYAWYEHKPSLHLSEEECQLLAEAFSAYTEFTFSIASDMA